MTEHPHVPSAFINNIRDEGTKGEACDWLQKQWNETCALTAEIKRLRAELNETSRLAYEWMICHDKLKAGEPYTFPSPPYNKTIDDLRAALAEAREVMKPFASLLKPHHADFKEDQEIFGINGSYFTAGDLRRAAQWLEKNP